MPPKSGDSSLPIHIGETIVAGVMELKEDVGKLGGKIDGIQSALGDLHGRVSQCMTRDECATAHRRFGPSPSSEMRQQNAWWDTTQKKVGVIVGLFAILGTLGGAFYWMSSAYTVIQRARVDIQATTEQASVTAAAAAKEASKDAVEAARKAAAEAATLAAEVAAQAAVKAAARERRR